MIPNISQYVNSRFNKVGWVVGEGAVGPAKVADTTVDHRIYLSSLSWSMAQIYGGVSHIIWPHYCKTLGQNEEKASGVLWCIVVRQYTVISVGYVLIFCLTDKHRRRCMSYSGGLMYIYHTSILVPRLCVWHCHSVRWVMTFTAVYTYHPVSRVLLYIHRYSGTDTQRGIRVYRYTGSHLCIHVYMGRY